MRRRTLLAAAGAAAGFRPPDPARADEPVDVALVLAVDVSRSVDPDEARLQREGYRSAMTDPRLVEAIRGGMLGGVAIAYVEWAGSEYQRLVLPWTRIGSQEQADIWATALDEAPRASLSWTSISGALDFSRRLLETCPFEATRQVIDVSGDGVNNSGGPAEEARDRAVAAGITINGLPILNDRPTFGRRPPIPLDIYYRESVIGGPGAFLVAAEDFEAFGLAVRRKLIREIAGLPGPVFG
ncbi:DUF1194 domain-containing protein [Falsiroseomonas selenitidurans]|uniref:DUF1194 domain-containing protein n=1 Tax=Falsiroseomonas selenitidurans TaxID=2716335 RepID=A0ABX1DZY4_9PROT|nr:DUF1194 domain-containing protein [Falsiroseomonas selenitidurans]NKC30436.1 DUF1194 domain-containing protein [Falsiroseomonas selenitidurans]OYW09997.1 MAG: hypothetical protein B7Z53_01855 [Rhodospirillales bacterium 12-71-4]